MNWGDSTSAWVENVSNSVKMYSYSQLHGFGNAQRSRNWRSWKKMRGMKALGEFWNQSVWAVTHTFGACPFTDCRGVNCKCLLKMTFYVSAPLCTLSPLCYQNIDPTQSTQYSRFLMAISTSCRVRFYYHTSQWKWTGLGFAFQHNYRNFRTIERTWI